MKKLFNKICCAMGIHRSVLKTEISKYTDGNIEITVYDEKCNNCKRTYTMEYCDSKSC